MLFFNGSGLTFEITGIPFTLSAETDMDVNIISFTVPAEVPEGFYNFNAVFINEQGNRGPIGSFNFRIKN